MVRIGGLDGPLPIRVWKQKATSTKLPGGNVRKARNVNNKTWKRTPRLANGCSARNEVMLNWRANKISHIFGGLG